MVETTYSLDVPVSVALLADLHGRPYDHILSSLETYKPDLIAIAGDIVYGSHPADDVSPLRSQGHVLPFLSACASLAPTFLSLGNHEWMLGAADLKLISSTGVTVLDNSYQPVMVGNVRIVIGGLTSAYVLDYRRFVAELDEPEQARLHYPRKETAEGLNSRREADKHTPDTSWLDAFAAETGYRVVMSHHPEYWPLIREYPFDLCLSAHAHGGQWRFYDPIHRRWQGVWAPGQYWFPRLTEGVHENRLVISRGLANTASVPRLVNPTEVVYIVPK